MSVYSFRKTGRDTHRKSEVNRIRGEDGDGRYPPTEIDESQQYPSVIIVCDFSKFAIDRFIDSVNQFRRIDFLIPYWPPLFGTPIKLLRDKATNFHGSNWVWICHYFNVRIILAPARAARTIGLAGRHVGLIKMGSHSISRGHADGISRNRSLAIARISMYITH